MSAHGTSGVVGDEGVDEVQLGVPRGEHGVGDTSGRHRVTEHRGGTVGGVPGQRGPSGCTRTAIWSTVRSRVSDMAAL